MPLNATDAMLVMCSANFVPEDIRSTHNGVCDSPLVHAQHRLWLLGLRPDGGPGHAGQVQFTVPSTNFTDGSWAELLHLMEHAVSIDRVEVLVVAVGTTLQPNGTLTIWDGNHRCACSSVRRCDRSCCSYARWYCCLAQVDCTGHAPLTL